MTTDELKNEIINSRKNRTGKFFYPPEIKAEVLVHCEKTKLSISRLCSLLDINPRTVHSWIEADRKKRSKTSSFTKIEINESKTSQSAVSVLTLTSPKGFHISGSFKDVLNIWSQIDASVIRK